MHFNVRYNLSKTYPKGTPEAIRKGHLYKRKVSQEHLIKEEVRIDLWVSAVGEQFKTNSGFKVAPIHWDFNGQRPKRSAPNYTLTNGLLSRQKTGVEELLLKASMENPMLTYEDVKMLVRDFLQGKVKQKQGGAFWGGYDEFISYKEKEVDASTLAKYKVLRNLLLEYEKRGKPLAYSVITSEFFLDFTDFLSSEKQQLNGTIEKYIRCIKAFMNWATEKGYNHDVRFRKYRCKRSETEVIFVSQQELERIERLPILTNPTMEKVRDIWLFGVYTGQRYSDILNLGPKEIIKNGKEWEWHLYQRKGRKPKKVVIPLMDKAKKILQKHGRWKDTRLLPALSNQKANKIIKDVCCLAGLKDDIYQVKYSGKKRVEICKPKYEFISTHTARKTHVTLSIEKGMNLETIMAITGHEDYATLKHYKKIVDSFVKEDYGKAWGK